jgi:hypothetical protein
MKHGFRVLCSPVSVSVILLLALLLWRVACDGPKQPRESHAPAAGLPSDPAAAFEKRLAAGVGRNLSDAEERDLVTLARQR